MKRSELVRMAAKKSGLSQATTKRAVNAFLEVVAMAVAAGEEVSIHSFGNITTREVKDFERGFYQPTHETVKVVSFKPSDTLKRRVNKRRRNG